MRGGTVDLRCGLVEAMAKAIADKAYRGRHGKDGAWERYKHAQRQHYLSMGEAALDAALGFLTDNGDSWNEAALDKATGDDPGYSLVDNFVAVLRDTGEKP